MLPQVQSQTKKPQVVLQNDNILESIRSVGNGVGNAVVKDVAAKTGADILASLLGKMPQSGDLTQNQMLELNRQQNQAERPAPRFQRQEVDLTPHIQAEQAKVAQELNAIRSELKSLMSAVKDLSQAIEKSIDETPVEPGVYHLNFFSRLRSMVMILREQVADSKTWLDHSTNRKKKQGYWNKAKTHGTMFTMNNERAIATQAG